MPGFQRRGQSKKLEGARSSRMGSVSGIKGGGLKQGAQLRGSPAVKDKGRQERAMEKEEEVRAQQREDGAAFIVAAGEREGGARLDQDGAKPHQTRSAKPAALTQIEVVLPTLTTTPAYRLSYKQRYPFLFSIYCHPGNFQKTLLWKCWESCK
ncbi:hypothetical protein CISG_07834 [Coccidioides immitis RMSCC 3703]|uniref:Uncharacterized protein n=1 Tax=Coccidioides immitis RMSCC 3703 TaxID=454286 RepID=A0A0J8R6I5_COCIT|nr:hypothetical protein CISG_07834 [Coccidioides immitis RMSCC 3703]